MLLIEAIYYKQSASILKTRSISKTNVYYGRVTDMYWNICRKTTEIEAIKVKD